MRFFAFSTLRRIDPEGRFTHHEARSAKEARTLIDRLAAEGRPAFVLCDYRMPMMDGIEFSRSLEPLRQRIPLRFALLTSLLAEDCRRSAFDAGVDATIEKPFKMSGWNEAIGGLLDTWAADLDRPGAAGATQP